MNSDVAPARVVIVDHCAELSGGEIALLRLLPALRRYTPHVVLAESGPLVDELRSAGISVEVLPLDEATRTVNRNDVGLAVAGRTALSVGGYVSRLAGRLRALQPALVHTNSLKSGYYGCPAARLARVPVVWHLRDRLSPDYLSERSAKASRLLLQTLPHGVLAPSAATMATAGPARRRQVRSVIADPYEPAVLGRPAPNGRAFTYGIVGRLAPWKGQDLFLDAFAAVHREQPASRARVIGSAMFSDHEVEPALRAQAATLGISDAVDFRGFRADIAGELAELDVLVHASRTPEPFGQVIVEGLAAGLPVIASGAGGPLEIISDEVDGLFFRPTEAADLSRQMMRLMINTDLRTKLGHNASVTAERYRPAPIAAAVESFYDSVLASRS